MRVLLALITVGVTIYGFVDCLLSTDDEAQGLPRQLWLLVTLVPLAGGLAWLTLGRRPSGTVTAAPRRVLAPDDDPEFLQSLDRTFRERRRQAAEEARRRRRQEETRRQDEARRQDEVRRRQAAEEPADGEPPRPPE